MTVANRTGRADAPYNVGVFAIPTLASIAQEPFPSATLRSGRPVTATIPGAWIAAVLIASIVAVGIMMARAGLVIDPESAINPVLLTMVIVVASLRYGLRARSTRWERRVGDAAEHIGLFTLVCLLGAVASYPAAAQTTGFVDPTLQHVDRILHFNWLSWYEMVSAHPLLQKLGGAAYDSIYLTPAILLLCFAWTGRQAEARLFIATFWLAAVLTLLVFPHIPAEGPLAFLWRGPIPYMPSSALYQSQLIPELRDHMLRDVSLGALRGLVCAPSFHTTSAVLFIATAWRVRSLRWPLIALNVAMLLSTPVEGTHYLADMLCGALVAIVALVAMRAAVRVRPAWESGVPPLALVPS